MHLCPFCNRRTINLLDDDDDDDEIVRWLGPKVAGSLAQLYIQQVHQVNSSNGFATITAQ